MDRLDKEGPPYRYSQIPGRRLVTYLLVRGGGVLHMVDPQTNELCGMGTHAYCGRAWFVAGGYKTVVRPRKVMLVCRQCVHAYLRRKRLKLREEG